MVCLLTIYLYIIGLCLAILAIEHIFREETVIDFKINAADWMLPIFSLYVFLSLSIFWEYTHFHIVIKHSDNNFRFVLDNFLESGGLIPIICFILSLLFGLLSKCSRIYLHPKYSENTAKRCFSCIILFVCVFLCIFILKSTNSRDEDISMFISRITVWAASIIGIWFPIGLGCKGLREKYKEPRKEDVDIDSLLKIIISKAKEFLLSLKSCVEFEWPMYIFIIAITLLLIIGYISPQTLDIIYFCFMNIASSFAIVFIVLSIIVYSYLYPFEFCSKRITKKAIRERNGKINKYNFLRYTIEKDKESNDKIIVTVQKRIVYKANNPDLFEEQAPISFNCSDENEIIEYLSKINRNRNNEIKDSFAKCEKKQKEYTVNYKG